MKLLALAAACLITAGCASEDPAQTARAMAQVFVRQQLKAPDSARFSTESETTVQQLADGVWQVKGWVDAPNALGATLRSDFYCELYPDPADPETWKRRNLLITPR